MDTVHSKGIIALCEIIYNSFFFFAISGKIYKMSGKEAGAKDENAENL
jgi:hypothetical protein